MRKSYSELEVQAYMNGDVKLAYVYDQLAEIEKLLEHYEDAVIDEE